MMAFFSLNQSHLLAFVKRSVPPKTLIVSLDGLNSP